MNANAKNGIYHAMKQIENIYPRGGSLSIIQNYITQVDGGYLVKDVCYDGYIVNLILKHEEVAYMLATFCYNNSKVKEAVIYAVILDEFDSIADYLEDRDFLTDQQQTYN